MYIHFLNSTLMRPPTFTNVVTPMTENVANSFFFWRTNILLDDELLEVPYQASIALKICGITEELTVKGFQLLIGKQFIECV